MCRAYRKACGFEDSAEAMYDYIVAQGVPFKAEFTDETKEMPASEASLYYSGSELAWPYRDMARPAPRGHLPSQSGWTGGQRLMKELIASAQELGVRYLTGASGEHLIQAQDGRVLSMPISHQGKWRRRRPAAHESWLCCAAVVRSCSRG